MSISLGTVASRRGVGPLRAGGAGKTLSCAEKLRIADAYLEYEERLESLLWRKVEVVQGCLAARAVGCPLSYGGRH